MKKLILEIDGVERSAWVQKVAGILWVHCDGETFSYTPPKQKLGGSMIESSDPSKIKAPMPGKIIKVNKASGDIVKEGEVVVVMEAMKMEYTLKAEAKGQITKVYATAGDQVTLGSMLIELEVADA